MLVWQDVILSFTYDRPPAVYATCPIPFSNPDEYSYEECIFSIAKILLNCKVKEMMGPAPSHAQSMLEARRLCEEVGQRATAHLQDKAKCTSLANHLERLSLGVHMGYAISRLGRHSQQVWIPGTADDCVQWSLRSIENILNIHRYAPGACRNWVLVHNATSCAIMLKEIGAIPGNKEGERKICSLIRVMEQEEKQSEWCDDDMNQWHAGPFSRALYALRECYRDNLAEFRYL